MPMRERVEADLQALSNETARDARDFLTVVRGVAAGESPDTALPVLLLAVSRILVTGARLGAISDVVPQNRFEPDLGSDEDVVALRDGLAALMAGIDDYADVIDPLTAPEVTPGQVSSDIADVAESLLHGLRHHADGEITEALWWWQFSYLSSWGASAVNALKVLQSILSHVRLDADEDTVAEAEFDALHR